MINIRKKKKMITLNNKIGHNFIKNLNCYILISNLKLLIKNANGSGIYLFIIIIILSHTRHTPKNNAHYGLKVCIRNF